MATIDQLRDLVAVGNTAFGHDRRPSDDELEADDLRQCTDPDSRVRRFVAYTKGRPVSAGGISAFGDLEFGFLWAGCTIPEAGIAWAAVHELRWV